MRFATLGVCLGLVLLAGGCDPVAESKLFREGIGTELTRSGLSEAARAQDEYIGFLCQQSGLEVVRSGDRMRCVAEAVGSRSWELIVQAGMNDIDVRCDAYLAWLDDKRRSQAPLLAQINALNTASIMIATGSATGSTPLLVVTQAFGLATNTLTNLHSRLLLQVNQSTVQAVVLRGRSDFREDVKSLRIDNRPAAIHVLRSYLNICMPFNIEASINTTVTAYELGGPDALVNRATVITPHTARSSFLLSDSRQPLPPAPDVVKQKDPATPFEITLPTRMVSDAQRSLCVAVDGQVGPEGSATRRGIADYLSGLRVGPPRATDARITPQTRIALSDLSERVPNCSAAGYANAFEVGYFDGGRRDKDLKDLRRAINKKFREKNFQRQVKETGSLDDLRDDIAVLRGLPGMPPTAPGANRQLDIRLIQALFD